MANRQVNKGIRYKILQQHKWRCFCCGKKSNRLSIHHIERQKDAPDRRNDLSNCVPVCNSCHKFLHLGEHKAKSKHIEQNPVKFKKKEIPEEILFFSEKDLKKTKFKNKKIIY